MIATGVMSLLALVREGKKTIDEVMDDPRTTATLDAQEETLRQQIINEAGDKFTRRARPSLIYVCVLAFAHDLLLAPYTGVVVLTGEKFEMLAKLLTALGLARSVMDKQGPWLGGLIEKWTGKK